MHLLREPLLRKEVGIHESHSLNSSKAQDRNAKTINCHVVCGGFEASEEDNLVHSFCERAADSDVSQIQHSCYNVTCASYMRVVMV